LCGWHAAATHERAGGEVESLGLSVDLVVTRRRRRPHSKCGDHPSSDAIADGEHLADICFNAIVPQCDAAGRLHKSRVNLKPWPRAPKRSLDDQAHIELSGDISKIVRFVLERK